MKPEIYVCVSVLLPRSCPLYMLDYSRGALMNSDGIEDKGDGGRTFP